LEKSLGILVQVVRNMDERVDTADKRLDATDARLAQLAEAQLSTGERFAQLADAQLSTDKHLARLTKAQLSYESRAGRLEESFGLLVQLVSDMDERHQREGRNGKSQG
jgi:hypothetical protein